MVVARKDLREPQTEFPIYLSVRVRDYEVHREVVGFVRVACFSKQLRAIRRVFPTSSHRSNVFFVSFTPNLHASNFIPS